LCVRVFVSCVVCRVSYDAWCMVCVVTCELCGCVYGRVRGCFAVAGVGLSMGVCV